MDQQDAAVPIVHLEAVEASQDDSGKICLSCAGVVASCGWTAPQLRVRQPAVVGQTLHFDLVATPPADAVAQMIETIRAKFHCELPAGVTLVRVHSRTNSVLVSVTDEPAE